MKIAIYIIVLFLLFGCSSKSQPKTDYIGGDFDYRDNSIVFTDFENGIGSIHLYDLVTSQLNKITSPQSGFDFRPRLSKDKKKILFISHPFPKREHPHLILKDLITNKTDTILKNQPFLTEAIFSIDDQEAFFFCASEYKNYSPIARAANHGFDLFAVNFQNKEIRRITNKKEYVMQMLNLAEDGEHIICAMPPEEGVVKISTLTGKKIPLDFKGNSRPKVEGLFHAICITNDSALYEAPYEIYSHDFVKNKSEFIMRTPDGSHFQIIRPDSGWRNVIFSTSSHGLYMYNRNTKELRNLLIEIKNKVHNH